VQRHLQLVNVRPEKHDDYLELHASEWPEIEQRISASNITNYSIFILGDRLAAYFEYTGDDFAADMAAMAADEKTQEWWALTDPCQEPPPATPAGTIWVDATEIWHLA
jgi:L-rhamnose mutarotase